MGISQRAKGKVSQQLNNVPEDLLQEAIGYINAAIGLFREKQLPIACIQHMDEKEKLLPGEDEFETLDRLAILPMDLHIHKTYENAFNKAALGENCGNSRWIRSSSPAFARNTAFCLLTAAQKTWI